MPQLHLVNMNKEFDFPAENFYYSTLEVIKNPRQFMLNNFQLEGEIGVNSCPQIGIFEWLAIFPKKESGYFSGAFVSGSNTERLRRLYGEIVRMKIPQRVKDLKMVRDSLWADIVTATLAQNGRPSIIIAKGEELSTGEALTFLFCPQGMLPEKALSLAQKTASDKYWELTARNN